MQAPSGEFRYTKLESVIFGPGKVAALGRELERRNLNRAMVITGKTLGASPLLNRVKEALSGRLAGVFAGIAQHTPSRTVDAAVEQAKELQADCLVSFGGGSPIDAAKAVAMALMTGSSEIRPLGHARSRESITGPEIPNFAVPTTLSAGEFTPAAGVTDENQRRKGAVMNAILQPKVVIMDPDLAVETPDWLWASTGVKALDHAFETAYSSQHLLVGDMFASRAIQVLAAHLRPSIDHSSPDWIAHRGDCQIGAWLSISALFNVRMGISHALGHQIGARWNVPHGVTSCITSPRVMRFMAANAPERFAAIAEGFGISFDPANPAKAASRCVERATELIGSLGVPTRLGEAGVPRAELGMIVEAVAAELSRSHVLNRPVTNADLGALLEEAY